MRLREISQGDFTRYERNGARSIEVIDQAGAFAEYDEDFDLNPLIFDLTDAKALRDELNVQIAYLEADILPTIREMHSEDFVVSDEEPESPPPGNLTPTKQDEDFVAAAPKMADMLCRLKDFKVTDEFVQKMVDDHRCNFRTLPGEYVTDKEVLRNLSSKGIMKYTIEQLIEELETCD